MGEARFLIKSTIEEFVKELSASCADPARLGKRHINLVRKQASVETRLPGTNVLAILSGIFPDLIRCRSANVLSVPWCGQRVLGLHFWWCFRHRGRQRVRDFRWTMFGFGPMTLQLYPASKAVMCLNVAKKSFNQPL